MASTKRVLIVSEHPYPDHATVRRNVRQLLDTGHRVDLVCLAPGDRAVHAAERGSGLEVFALHMAHKRTGAMRYLQEYLGFWLWSLAVSSALALRHRYAAVLVDNPPDLVIFVSALARLRGARVVLEMFELTPELTAARLKLAPDPLLVRTPLVVERLATWWADQIIVVSRQCQEVLVGRGVDPRKISVVPNTLPVPPVVAWVRPESETPFIVTHCTLIERYGVQIAISALAQLQSRWPDLTLRVLGDGEYKPRLVALVAELGLEDRVVFRGFRPWLDAIAEIRQAAVGIVAVIADGYGELLLPTKLLEYALNEVPVACADLATIRQHFPTDSLAYFDPGDASALARQIDRLLSDRREAREQAGRAKSAVQSLAWDVMAPRYMAALGLALDSPLVAATAV